MYLEFQICPVFIVCVRYDMQKKYFLTGTLLKGNKQNAFIRDVATNYFVAKYYLHNFEITISKLLKCAEKSSIVISSGFNFTF